MKDAMLMEEQRLAQVQGLIEKELGLLQEEAEKKKGDILSSKESLREEASEPMSSLWQPEGFEQLVELSQFFSLVSGNCLSYETMLKGIYRLEAQRKAPYFARIDFTFDADHTCREIYIGRFSLMDGHRIEVHDWRSPIAGVFYQHGLGKASYEAPAGTISGEVTLKRQYEIREGKLSFFFDAELEIMDEALRKLLAGNASPQMKSIVETIQRDQDMVIRDQESDVLIVQGVAGSGKTSIALHRVAYLMYRGLTHRLASQNIVIISPNTLFERYIAGVLPELGEEDVSSYVLEELWGTLFKVPKLQTRHQLLETLLTNTNPWTKTMRSSLVFKTSRAFQQMLDALNPKAAKHSELLGAYQRLFEDRSYFFQLAKDIPLPEDIEDILLFTQENLRSRTLFFDDASALAYLALKGNSYRAFAHIKQVVVDEAQDYYPLHFAFFRRLFPNARFTLLGDIHQTAVKPESLSFYEEIQEILESRKAQLITLDKSFRCAKEIMGFAADLLGVPIQAFGRESEPPKVEKLRGEDDLDGLLTELAACKAKGYETIGIIGKSEKDYKRLYDRLSKQVEVSLVKNAFAGSLRGVSILPVYLAKGLEFDAALLWDVDAAHYASEDDRKLLYIACTRALHRLRLFYHGQISPLCPEENAQ